MHLFDSAFFFYVLCQTFIFPLIQNSKKGKTLNSDAKTQGTKSAYISALLKLTHLKLKAKIRGQKIQVVEALSKKNNAMLTLILSFDIN